MDKQKSNNSSTTSINGFAKQSKSVHVTVKNKSGTVADEDARAVTSYNEVGIFDVLPLHTHFITLIRKRVTIHSGKDGRDRNIEIGTGLMKVDDNNINIYVGLPDTETAREKQKK